MIFILMNMSLKEKQLEIMGHIFKVREWKYIMPLSNI